MRLTTWKCAVLLLFLTTSAGAATKTWTGAVDRNWSTPGNWTDGTAPVNGDALVFPDVGFKGTTYELNDDLAPGLELQSLTIARPGPTGSYQFKGNLFVLSRGITTDFATFLNPVTLGASQAFYGPVVFQGPFDLAGFELVLTPCNVSARFMHWVSASGAVTVPADVCDSGQLFVQTTGPFAGRIAGFGRIDLIGPFATTSVEAIGRLIAEGSLGDTAIFHGQFDVGHAIALLSTHNLLIQDSELATDVSSNTTPGVGYDQIKTTGTVTLSRATLNVILPSNPPAPPPGAGQQFVIIDNDGTDPVVGTFEGLPEGAIFTAPQTNGDTSLRPTNFQITYIGGTGNDVVLTSLGPPRRRRSVR